MFAFAICHSTKAALSTPIPQQDARISTLQEEYLLMKRCQVLLICSFIQAVVERTVERGVDPEVAQDVRHVKHRASFKAHVL